MVRCKTILIVEDDESIREVLRMALELEGYTTIAAENGEKGLEALKKIEHPCLILLDLMMPVMDGWQFASHLKEDMILAQIPVAVVTAYSDKAGSIDAKAVVKKPIDIDTMLNIVRTYCGG